MPLEERTPDILKKKADYMFSDFFGSSTWWIGSGKWNPIYGVNQHWHLSPFPAEKTAHLYTVLEFPTCYWIKSNSWHSS